MFWIGILPGQVNFPFIYTESEGLQYVSAGHKRPLVANFAASKDACVSFDGKRVLFSGKQRPADSFQIWEVALAGGEPRRITSFKEDAVAPFYLPADKIIYSRRTPQGFQIEIMPMDGSTPPLRLTYNSGDHIATDVLRDGRILFEASHDLYTVYPDGSGVETYRCDHGHDRRQGREVSSGDIIFQSGDRLSRFTSAKAVEVPVELPKGKFNGPIAEIAPGDWLVSDGRALYRVQTNTGLSTKIVDDATQPVIVRPRTPPKWFPSGLGDREGANLLCLNVYTSKTVHIPETAVAAVRVWTDDARPLGEAPVEKDGSFFVTVPSEHPIRFELLDRNGKTVAAEKSYFWARRGEQRVCVGCHAGPERAPENAVPQVLLRTTTPVKMELPK